MTLKRRRSELDLTQREVADAVGVTPKTYYRWEQGRIPEQWLQLMRLCRLYGCTAEELMAELEKHL